MTDLTTDQVIDYFVEGYLHAHDGVNGDGREEIILWHAAEIRRAKIEALREAAGFISLSPYYSRICATDRINAETAAESWLRYHADRVEKEHTDD